MHFSAATYSSLPSRSQLPQSICAVAEIANPKLMPCSPLPSSEPPLSRLSCSTHPFLKVFALTQHYSLTSVFVSKTKYCLLRLTTCPHPDGFIAIILNCDKKNYFLIKIIDKLINMISSIQNCSLVLVLIWMQR